MEGQQPLGCRATGRLRHHQSFGRHHQLPARHAAPDISALEAAPNAADTESRQVLHDLLNRVRRFQAEVHRSREEFKAIGIPDRKRPPAKKPCKRVPPGPPPRSG